MLEANHLRFLCEFFSFEYISPYLQKEIPQTLATADTNHSISHNQFIQSKHSVAGGVLVFPIEFLQDYNLERLLDEIGSELKSFTRMIREEVDTTEIQIQPFGEVWFAIGKYFHGSFQDEQPNQFLVHFSENSPGVEIFGLPYEWVMAFAAEVSRKRNIPSILSKDRDSEQIYLVRAI